MLIRNAIVSSSHERQINIYRKGGGVRRILAVPQEDLRDLPPDAL